MKLFCALLVVLFTGWFGGNKGVYLNEMRSLPVLQLSENTLTVTLSQSLRNTAMPVAKLNVAVDHKKKRVLISARKTTTEGFNSSFVINLNNYKVPNAKKYAYFWQEPNKINIKLALSEPEPVQ